MTIKRILRATVTCRSCSLRFDASFDRLIWGDSSDYRHRIFTNQVNIATCPDCRAILSQPFAFLYMDNDLALAVWYEPQPDPTIDEDARYLADEYGPGAYLASAPRIADWEAFKATIRDFEEGRRRGLPIDESRYPRPPGPSIFHLDGDEIPLLPSDLEPLSPRPTALDLISNAERSYQYDAERLRQLATLRGCIDDSRFWTIEQLPPEMLKLLLGLVDHCLFAVKSPQSSAFSALVCENINAHGSQSTLLDREVARVCELATGAASDVASLPSVAITMALLLGTIIARRQQNRVDDLWPSGALVDPVRGEHDTQTIEFLDYISSSEFDRFFEGRLRRASPFTLSTLHDAYVSRIRLTRCLDLDDGSYAVQLSAIVRHALLFGLWFGLRYPRIANRLLKESCLIVFPHLWRTIAKSIGRKVEPRAEVGVFVGSDCRDAQERSENGECGVEADAALADLLAGALALLSVMPSRYRCVVEDEYKVATGVWTEPQLRGFRRAFLRVLREDRPEGDPDRKLVRSRFPKIEGSEIDIRVTPELRDALKWILDSM